VWGGGNVSTSVHEAMKWYCISVEHVILFLLSSQFLSYYINNLKLINCIYIGTALGIVFVL
jgi:hypothetical protein